MPTSQTGMLYEIYTGDSPIVATAIHHGHGVRPEVQRRLRLTEAERLREEDPFTGRWTKVAENRVIAHRSRFEVDLNRPRDAAVYQLPEQAWGLNVWRSPPGTDLVKRSLEQYDEFYQRMYRILKDIEREYGSFVVLDLHSYNHRRSGKRPPPADPERYPDINVGTGSLNRSCWAPLVDGFIDDLRQFDFPTGQLDVRENVSFRGGYFPSWVHRMFPKSGCALAVEVKKIFMDEWTGELDERLFDAVADALRATIPGLIEGLRSGVRRDLHIHCA